MSMVANKIKGVRAALVEDVERAKLSREHNDANVLCLGARFLNTTKATEILKAWLETHFSTEGRHLARVKKINALDETGA